MKEKVLLTLTAGEFIQALQQGLGLAAFEGTANNVVPDHYVKKHYVYGLAGLAQLLGCSISTASRIHRSGEITSATKRSGRILIFDEDLVMALLSIKRNRKK